MRNWPLNLHSNRETTLHRAYFSFVSHKVGGSNIKFRVRKLESKLESKLGSKLGSKLEYILKSILESILESKLESNLFRILSFA